MSTEPNKPIGKLYTGFFNGVTELAEILAGRSVYWADGEFVQSVTKEQIIERCQTATTFRCINDGVCLVVYLDERRLFQFDEYPVATVKAGAKLSHLTSA